MLFDPSSGWFRQISMESAEVVQAVYPAVRRHDWATIPYAIKKLRFIEDDGRFEICYEAETTEAAQKLGFTLTAAGSATEGLVIKFEGEPGVEFASNRIGLCLLHPAALCAGREYRVTGADGQEGEGRFPNWISPNTVQSGMVAIRHEVAPGVPLEMVFEGDLFEMEDQRNYSDDSFKSYSTASGQKQPWTARPGEKIVQTIRIRIPGAGAQSGVVEPPFVDVDFGPAGEDKLPMLGVSAAGHGERLSEQAVERLKAINLHHVRLDLKLGKVPVMAALSLGARQAADIGSRLLLGLHLGEDGAKELRSLRPLLDQIQPGIAAWMVFPPAGGHAGGRWIELVKSELGSYAPDAPILIGNAGGYLGLNRLGMEAELGNGLVYAANPTVHDEQNLTVIANLGGIGETAASGRQLAGARPLYVSPVHFRAAGARSLRHDALGLPGDVDLRQGSLLGAAWTVGVIQQLARGKVDAVTLFETTGWRGLMERQKGSPAPTRFPSTPGMVFPLYHVIADLGESVGGRRLALTMVQPGRVAAFGIALEGGLRLWVANLTAEPVVVRVSTDSEAEYSWVRMLDETSYEQATSDPALFRAEALSLLQKRDGRYPIALLPYGVARLDEADAQVESA